MAPTLVIYYANSKKTCCVPGCGRSVFSWNNTRDCGEPRGRQPVVFTVQCEGDELDVCDIHFTVHDFCPWYNFHSRATRYGQPVPPHLQSADRIKSSLPSLFLDEADNLAAQSQASQAGQADWWRLAKSYDPALDLDNLLALNAAPRGDGIVVEHDVKPLDKLHVFENTLDDSLSLEHSDQQARDVSLLERVHVYEPDVAALFLSPAEGVPCWERQGLTLSREERRRLFRTLCTTPLSLPDHWAVHAYVDHVIISKDVFSRAAGFVVERATRITSGMRCSDVHCRGQDVSHLAQGLELSSVAQVEQLVERLDQY